jgi:hypothetical protein
MSGSSQQFLFVVVLVLGLLWSTSSAISVDSELEFSEYRVKRQGVSLTAIISALVTFLTDTITNVETAVNATEVYVQALLGVVTTEVSDLSPLITGITNTVNSLLSLVGSLLGGLGGRRKRQTPSETALLNAVKAITTNVTALSKQTVSIPTTALNTLKTQLQTQLTQLKALKPSSITQTIANAAVQNVTKLGVSAMGAIAAVQTTANTQSENLLAKTSAVTGAINTTLNQLGQLSIPTTGINVLLSTFEGITTTIQTADSDLSKAAGAAATQASAIVTKVQTFSTGLATQIQAIVTEFAPVLNIVSSQT